jgi:predicted dehydrogenase
LVIFHEEATMNPEIDRREFCRSGAGLGAAALAAISPTLVAAKDKPSTKKIKVGVIGCGSVARKYFPHLVNSPHVELTSTCDIIPERAVERATRFNVPNNYPHIDKFLAGAAFDLFVNLTDMQEHERLNRQAIEAGKHVWSEKPIANSVEAGQELLELARKKGVRVWGAPTAVASPQFAFMAKTLNDRKLGRVAAANASYGHLGPGWAEFFYSKGGGSLPDLGVYHLTTLTGLLGPAKSVAAMTSIVTPTRNIDRKGTIKVSEEDNAMVLLDHGGGTLSHIQCGFNYYTAEEHDASNNKHHSVVITGTGGTMSLVGYDWAPHGVDLSLVDRKTTREATDAKEYVWENGASLVAECLATGREPLFTAEHALHVVEVITAARLSQNAGRRVPIKSTFKWPIVAS